MTKPSSKPVQDFRLGRIKALVWANDTANGTRHNVTFSRIYKQDDKWHETGSFGRDDLPLVAKLADQAHSWIFEQRDTSDQSPESDA